MLKIQVMNDGALERLSKVIALADSAHDGEALAALRATRNMLRHDGVELSSVLQDAMRSRVSNFVRPSMDIVTSLQREVVALQRQLAAAQKELREQRLETRHWQLKAEKK